MSRKMKAILALMLALAGIGVMAYPALSSFLNARNGSFAIQELEKTVEKAEQGELAAQRALAESYNASLAEGVVPEDYSQILDFGDGVMGYLRIPKIRVSLPVCHGVSEEVLATSVGHMPESAFPIGGEGNHSVLTGHTGHPTAELLTDLSELAEGDGFQLRILGDTLHYQVEQISVVLPDEAEKLAAGPGEEYCTLVTCTPYGINSHRLLVRGVRVMQPEEETSGIQTYEDPAFPPELLLAVVAAGGILAAMAVLILRKR